MKRNELIKEIKKYFSISELVCPHCVNTFGENAWQFLSTELLNTIYILRTKIINKPMIVNNGSNYTQRGLRCNICQLVKDKTNANKIYLSAHMLGKAIDFHVNGVNANDIRDLIRSNIDEFEYPIRLESNESAPTWVHVDTFTLNDDIKLKEFSA